MKERRFYTCSLVSEGKRARETFARVRVKRMTETRVSFFYESSRLPSPSLVVLANYLRRRESGLCNVSDVSSGIRSTLTNTLHLWLRRWFYSVNIEIAWRTRKLISDFREKKKNYPRRILSEGI